MNEVLVSGLDFPEGPAFDRQGGLWLVELKAGNLVYVSTDGIKRIATGGAPNGIALDASGRVVFCDAEQNAIRRYNPVTGKFTTLAAKIDSEPLAKPNDLAFDASGNLVFTCPGNSRQEPTGYVCCLTRDGNLKRIADNLYFPNGLAFEPNTGMLIVAETYRQRLWRGMWKSQSSTWESSSPFVDVGGPIGPDGMAFGESGTLYVAVYGSGMIKTVRPDGTLGDSIHLSGENPTNVAISTGGYLVATEAQLGQVEKVMVQDRGLNLFGAREI